MTSVVARRDQYRQPEAIELRKTKLYCGVRIRINFHSVNLVKLPHFLNSPLIERKTFPLQNTPPEKS